MREIRGFSLVEALLSLTLLAVVLGLVARLAYDYTKAGRQTTGKERSLAVALVLQDLVRETESGYDFRIDPTGPGSFDYKRLDPADLSEYMTPPLDEITILYEHDVAEQTLYRSVTRGLDTTRIPVAHGLTGFAVEVEPAQVRLVASVQERTLVRTIRATAVRWVERP